MIHRRRRIAAFASLLFAAGCCSALENVVRGPAATRREKEAIAAGSPTPTRSHGDILDSVKGAARVDRQLASGAREAKAAKDNYVTAVVQAVDKISIDDERAIGQATALEVIGANGGLILDETLIAYVNEVTNLVAQQGVRLPAREGAAPRQQARRFFTGVVDSDEINAWSAPGGYLFLTRGLVEKLGSESELAWVLGHEMAHVDREDALKALKVALRAQASVRGVADPAGARNIDFGDSAFFRKIVTRLAEAVMKGGFEREDENAADALGLQYSIAAGYDADGATRVLATLGAASGSQKAGFRSGHEPPDQRLSHLRQTIDASKGGIVGVARFEQRAILPLESWKIARAPAN